MLFDAHLHLSELDEETRTRPLPGAGLSSIHDPEDPLLASRLAEVLLSYGIHPLWIGEKGRSLAVLGSLAGSGAIAAVGEFGFDFYHERTPEQERRQQLSLLMLALRTRPLKPTLSFLKLINFWDARSNLGV